jgi:hypothetical protein
MLALKIYAMLQILVDRAVADQLFICNTTKEGGILEFRFLRTLFGHRCSAMGALHGLMFLVPFS